MCQSQSNWKTETSVVIQWGNLREKIIYRGARTVYWAAEGSGSTLEVNAAGSHSRCVGCRGLATVTGATRGRGYGKKWPASLPLPPKSHQCLQPATPGRKPVGKRVWERQVLCLQQTDDWLTRRLGKSLLYVSGQKSLKTYLEQLTPLQNKGSEMVNGDGDDGNNG